jgi:hypothetical protein
MAKLRLTLEDLAVESFDSTPSRVPSSGTVQAHEASEFSYCTCFCAPQYTVEYFCGNSLDGTCNEATCNCTTENGGPGECPVTYNATCPAPCRTQGVYC